MNKALSHKLPALLTAFCLLLICLLTALPTDVLADTTIEEDQQALNDLEAQRKAYMQQLEALQAQINASRRRRCWPKRASWSRKSRCWTAPSRPTKR